jgi:hypothetical protein
LDPLVHVGAFVVLETGNISQYANAKYGYDFADQQHKLESLLQTRRIDEEDHVNASLGGFYVAGKYAAHEDFPTSEKLLSEKWPRLRLELPAYERARRLPLWLNQLKHSRDCAQLIRQHETRTRGRYSTIVKLRDNSIVLKPVPNSLFSASRALGKGHTRNGQKLIADKVMIIPRKYLWSAMESPYEVLFNDTYSSVAFHNITNVTDIESVLNEAFRLYSVPTSLVSADELPIVDGRPLDGEQGISKEKCLVPTSKDEWPTKPWTVEINECNFSIRR